MLCLGIARFVASLCKCNYWLRVVCPSGNMFIRNVAKCGVCLLGGATKGEFQSRAISLTAFASWRPLRLQTPPSRDCLRSTKKEQRAAAETTNARSITPGSIYVLWPCAINQTCGELTGENEVVELLFFKGLQLIPLLIHLQATEDSHIKQFYCIAKLPVGLVSIHPAVHRGAGRYT